MPTVGSYKIIFNGSFFLGGLLPADPISIKIYT